MLCPLIDFIYAWYNLLNVYHLVILTIDCSYRMLVKSLILMSKFNVCTSRSTKFHEYNFVQHKYHIKLTFNNYYVRCLFYHQNKMLCNKVFFVSIFIDLLKISRIQRTHPKRYHTKWYLTQLSALCCHFSGSQI